LPFALFTVLGGVQCTASAAAAGDEYDVRSVTLVQGLTSAAAGALGGVVQTTPYYGHPAYKQMGAGWFYVVAGGAVLALAGIFGWFANFFEYFPSAVVFPIIVYVGLRTIAHSCESMPPRDFAALAFAAVPVLAYVVVILASEIFAGRTPSPSGAGLFTALRCLGNGFVITSLLWATALIALLDAKPVWAALTLFIAAACSLFGLIHSPLEGGPIAWPGDVWRQLTFDPHQELQYLSPFHWTVAYALSAVVVLVCSVVPVRPEKADEPH